MENFEQQRNESVSRKEKAFIILSAFFIGALILTNLIAGKFFVIFGRELSCGVIAYPVTFLVTDLISEIYGQKRANMLVKSGFVVSVFVLIILWIASSMPIWENSPVDATSFSNVFGIMPGIVFGSMIAYLTAQFLDVQLFEFWRKVTDGKHLWLRNNGSTIISQLVDSFLVNFIVLVLWFKFDGVEETTAYAIPVVMGIVFSQYIFKAAIAILDTPLVYLGVSFLKNWIGKNE